MAIFTSHIRIPLHGYYNWHHQAEDLQPGLPSTGQCFIALRPINIGVEVTYITMEEKEPLERVPNVAYQC